MDLTPETEIIPFRVRDHVSKLVHTLRGLEQGVQNYRSYTWHDVMNAFIWCSIVESHCAFMQQAIADAGILSTTPACLHEFWRRQGIANAKQATKWLNRKRKRLRGKHIRQVMSYGFINPSLHHLVTVQAGVHDRIPYEIIHNQRNNYANVEDEEDG